MVDYEGQRLADQLTTYVITLAAVCLSRSLSLVLSLVRLAV